jgi:tRNA C32,U32 (ribose-2'-O)-methylase TrmJ
MEPRLNGVCAQAPAVGLVDPKFPHNVGAAVRAASCYGIGQVWFTGDRVRLDASKGELRV